jgi:hypothetical protein
MKQIKKSMFNLCADAHSCFPTWQKKPLKVDWLKDRVLYRGITNMGEIICTPVYFATDEHRTAYIMDAITGTCYKGSKCCTSDRLQLLSYKPELGLDKELLSMRNNKTLGV